MAGRHSRPKDYAAAETALRKAVELDPASPEAYRALSRIARLRGDMRTELALLKKTCEVAPDDPKDLGAYIIALWPLDPAETPSAKRRHRDHTSPPRAMQPVMLASRSDTEVARYREPVS